MAAVLAAGPTAVVSHRSAAQLYELLPYPAQSEAIHVTVTERHHRRHGHIVVHRTRELSPHEIRRRSNVPVTAVPRTLIDLASCCEDQDLETAVAEVNARVGRWEVDFLWREAQLVVEVDVYSTHSSPTAFERGRRKNAELEDLGHTVHRVTPGRFKAELARVRRLL